MMSGKKDHIIVSSIIFIWIVLVNFVVQLIHDGLNAVGFCNWAFFLITVLFFLVGEEDVKKKFRDVFCGSCVGIVLAGLLVVSEGVLMNIGLNRIAAIMIPLSVCLALIIIFHPLVPVLFNNCAFAYFLVSLIHAEQAFTGIPSYIGSAAAGHIIVNTGTLLIIHQAGKLLAKKQRKKM